MSQEFESGVKDKSTTPRDSEDLFSMLRTRWNDGVFSDIKVAIFGREYCLHRVVLCRSPFFDKLLRGEWSETNDKVLKLKIPSTIISCEGFELSLSHMYANPILLNHNNVLQVIAAANYLGLQELCIQGAEFVIESMHDPDFFIDFYCGGHSLEYGPHTEKIQKAGWRYLCMMGADHLRAVLPHLDTYTLKKLLQCDEFWIKTELDRYNLAKEVLFSKLFHARQMCKEYGGTAGMPVWSDPTLRSPRDPWNHPYDNMEAFSRPVGGSNSNSSHNQTVDSVEIREDSPAVNESHPDAGEPVIKQSQSNDSSLQDVAGTSAIGVVERVSTSPRPTMEDHLNLDEYASDHQTQEERLSSAMAINKDVPEETKQLNTQHFQVSNPNQETAGINIDEAVTEVNGVLQAVSDVFGLEGIQYSHLQHIDLCKIEIELHQLGLNHAHHALLQGMRTQGILYRRIEACAAVEGQEMQTGRLANYPKNLYPYSLNDFEELYSKWTLPPFRFGVEFSDVKNIAPQTEKMSEAHYYAGSVWKLRLLIDDVKNEVRVHVFRNQRILDRIGGPHIPCDSREVLCTRFKFLVPSRDGLTARSSRPGKFQQKKGRGWNDFLRLDDIEKYITPWGSLRVVALVFPPFESDQTSSN
eukprot:g4697.t1